MNLKSRDTTYTLNQIASIVGGKLVQGDSNTIIETIYTDSRKPQAGANSLFIAIKGQRHDGNQYVQELYDRGQRNFILSKLSDLKHLPDAHIVLVNDSLSALQELAAYHRNQFRYPVIGITGSNAKTIIKEWLYQLLHKHYHIVRSPRSYNSQLGVPLSVWLMNESHNMAIFEAGISLPGEMEKLEKIIAPDIGIFTNIGAAHQENFESITQKVSDKMMLFQNCKLLIYCKDHEEIDRAVSQKFNATAGKLVRSWSQKGHADLIITTQSLSANGTKLIASYNNIDREIWVPFVHPAAIENACHCWLVMLELGIADEQIVQGMSTLSSIAMRMELIEGINGCLILNDTYNSDVESLGIALEHLVQHGKNSRRTAIISDIMQSGEQPEILYRKVAAMLSINGINRLIGIGSDISDSAELFNSFAPQFYPDTASFLSQLIDSDVSKEDILLKGSRQFAFEQISERLAEKTHETALEIDLNRITDNLNFVKSRLLPETKIMAMVKAFAYGSGSYEIARLLQHHRVDYLAVAYADEGIDLRKAGISLPILVLNPELSAYRSMIDYDLEPQIFSFRTLRHFAKALESTNSGSKFPVHIKINTGMNRLGFDIKDIEKLGRELDTYSELLEVKSVFSHLSASDDDTFDQLTKTQISQFNNAVKILTPFIPNHFFRHILNSNGVTRHQEAQMDMVRLGLALYGLSSHPEARKNLKPAGKLVSTISQIRVVPAGEGVGYSPHHKLKADKTIAVLPVGYADGLPRKLGHGKWSVFVQGSFAPIEGNVCMDMCMVDISGLGCKEGDRVEIFGDNAEIYSLAKALDTIPYEILTHVSHRVKRVYLQE